MEVPLTLGVMAARHPLLDGHTHQVLLCVPVKEWMRSGKHSERERYLDSFLISVFFTVARLLHSTFVSVLPCDAEPALEPSRPVSSFFRKGAHCAAPEAVCFFPVPNSQTRPKHFPNTPFHPLYIFFMFVESDSHS